MKVNVHVIGNLSTIRHSHKQNGSQFSQTSHPQVFKSKSGAPRVIINSVCDSQVSNSETEFNTQLISSIN